MHSPLPRFAVIGPGRLGTALHRALRDAGFDAGPAPLGRGASEPADADVVILCVPDRAIADVAASLPLGPLVVHCSGASALDLLAPHARRAVLHPLLSVPNGATALAGAFAAVRASEPADLELLRGVAERLDLRPIKVDDEHRAAYHAAATLASNALVAVQSAAAELGATAGLPREALAPLASAALAQVQAAGDAALTGPAARGDWETVARQRGAVAERTPELLALFDAATAACARIAGSGPVPSDLTTPIPLAGVPS